MVFIERGESYGMPPLLEDATACFKWIADSPRRWSELLIRHSVAHRSFNDLNVSVQDWQTRALTLAYSLGAPVDVHDPPCPPEGEVVPAADDFDFECWCGFRASSYRSLVIHATHRHGYRKDAYFYVTECGTCLACLRCFHTNFRLLSHLDRTSAPCLAVLAAHYPPL